MCSSLVPMEDKMDDYKRGFEQFRQMVGDENIDGLIERFRSVCPDFEKEVVSVVGGRIWTRTRY